MKPDYCRHIVGNEGTRRRPGCEEEDTVTASLDPVVLDTTTIEVVERAREITRDREEGKRVGVVLDLAQEVDRLAALSSSPGK